MGLKLRENLVLRKDIDRVVCYCRDDGSVGGSLVDEPWRLFHPKGAVLLALMDGLKTHRELAEEFAFLTDTPLEETEMAVARAVETCGNLLVETDQGGPAGSRYDPQELLMDAASVDLSTERMKLPISCVWVVTLDCAFACRYCYADHTGERVAAVAPPAMNLAGVSRVVEQFRELQLGTVGLSGGDPFFHPEIMAILGMLATAGYTPEVPTKTPLSRTVLTQIRELGYPALQFSIDSPIHDEVISAHLGINGREYLHRVRRSLLTAGELGFKIGINAVITTRNIGQVADMVRYYGELGFVYRLGLSHVGPSIYRRFPDLPVDRLRLTAAEARVAELGVLYPHMRARLNWLAEACDMTEEERGAWHRARPACSGGRTAFTLLPDGGLTVCEELYYHPEFLLGNVLETPIAELWNSERMFRILHLPQESIRYGPCRTCPTYTECTRGRGRCWRRAVRTFWDQPEPHTWPDPYCPRAPRTSLQGG